MKRQTDRHSVQLTGIFLELLTAYHSLATRVSQLKIWDFSGETFKGFEVL